MSLKKLQQNPTDLKNRVNALMQAGLIQVKTSKMLKHALKNLDKHSYLANIIQGLELQATG